ncbi:MAG: glycosyltransferase family 2 protein [Cyanobium sp.]
MTPSLPADANLRFRLYCAAREGVQGLRRLVPPALVPPRRDLSASFAIGVTTYSPRYERYLKPLHAAISRIFPEVPLTIAVNGHGSADAQARYLERFQREICASAPAQQRFLLHQHPHGLTTLWNGMLAASPGDRPLLILNDDLRLHAWMRRWAEGFDWGAAELALLNSSWSHFVIAPSTVERVGAFDPGFPGIGFEDMDYTARAGLAGVPISNHLCGYLRHHDDKPTATSFDAISGRVWGKYTSANQEHFTASWEPCGEAEGIWIKQLRGWVKPRGPVTRVPRPVIPAQAWRGNVLLADEAA